jgi:hypothetical protein
LVIKFSSRNYEEKAEPQPSHLPTVTNSLRRYLDATRESPYLVLSAPEKSNPKKKLRPDFLQDSNMEAISRTRVEGPVSAHSQAVDMEMHGLKDTALLARNCVEILLCSRPGQKQSHADPKTALSYEASPTIDDRTLKIKDVGLAARELRNSRASKHTCKSPSANERIYRCFP